MDPYDGRRAPGQAPPASAYPAGPLPSARRQSSHTSIISDISDFDTFDAYQSAAALQELHHPPQPQPQPQPQSLPPLYLPQAQPPSQVRGRESLVSLNSDYGSSNGPDTAYYPSATSTTAPPPPPPVSTSTAAPTLQYADHSAAGGGGWMATQSNYGEGITLSPVSTEGYSSLPHAGAAAQRTSSVSSAPPARGLGRLFSRKPPRLHTSSIHGPIMEEPGSERESIDLTNLVQNAAPMGASSSPQTYAPLAGQDPDGTHGGSVPFDITGYLGPTTVQDDAFAKKLQDEEASGRHPLSLGIGFEPTAKLKESELLKSPAAASARSLPFGGERGGALGRALSMRWPSRAAPSAAQEISRQGTVKVLGQNEANRRGEIVEIIMEEDEEDGEATRLTRHGLTSEVDLSVVSGTLSSGSHRQSMLPSRTQTTHVFYPRPNWRPFSMRWPYLLFMILLSVGLGITQEVFYRLSQRQPLVSFNSPSEIPGFLYFVVKFVPTIITVTYGVLWQITDFEVKRLEAFYQMSKENGAVAAESINVDYVTYFAFFRPFLALRCKHYAVCVSSVISLLSVSLVPTLGAASIVLTPDRAARQANPLGEKQVIISVVWSRMLTATLAVIAVLGCILFWLLQTRRSGLLSDVRGIAGLASMAVVSHIMTDFKDMDVATHEDIHHKLKDRRYVLRNSSLAPDDGNPVSSLERGRYRVNHLSKNPHPLMLRALGCLPYVAGILLFAGFLPVVLFTDANVITDKAAWLLTAMAVGIKLGWGGLETAVRMMEPYYILSKRRAPPKTLTLDYTAMPFLWVALQALRNKHLLVFFVSFGTVMTELLTVMVTSLATVQGRDFIYEDSSTSSSSDSAEGSDRDSGQETETSFWVSLVLVMFILTYMGVVALVVFVRRRRPFLPRQPNTISSVLAYIHQSRLLASFEGTTKMSNAEMLQRLEELDNEYGLGWFKGRDGQTHCGVDQEPLISSYKVGYDYSRSNKPWNEQPAEWL